MPRPHRVPHGAGITNHRSDFGITQRAGSGIQASHGVKGLICTTPSCACFSHRLERARSTYSRAHDDGGGLWHVSPTDLQNHLNLVYGQLLRGLRKEVLHTTAHLHVCTPGCRTLRSTSPQRFRKEREQGRGVQVGEEKSEGQERASQVAQDSTRARNRPGQAQTFCRRH